MRKLWLAPVLLAVAIVVQLAWLDGVHLPRGGQPDLVLILLVAIAMAEGPARGTVLGFAAGLCLDLAPPGTGLLGQYALVFCLAGWAAGSLGRPAKGSPLRSLALTAVVVAAAETITAGLGKVLEPAQVSVTEIRHFLPVTVAYDLLICPFVLYLVVLAGTAQATSKLVGTGMLAGLARPRGSDRRHRPHEPRLDPAAARAGDGWVGGGPARHPGGRSPAGRPARLHPGSGVPGSASGYGHHRGLPGRPVQLRLSAGRRGDGAIGSLVSSGPGAQLRRSHHPGLKAGPSRRVHFGGDLGRSAARGQQPAAPSQRAVRINFSGRRADDSLIRRIGLGWLTAGRAGAPAPLRMGARRSGLAVPGYPGGVAHVPTLHFSTARPPVVRRTAATPKFRRSSRLRPAAPATGLVGGGAADQSAFLARRRAIGPARLRLVGRGGAGMLGGTRASALRRPPSRRVSQPRFGYGRRSVLSFLTGRRVGGRWLAKQRVGRRSGVWLVGRKTGGMR